MENILSDYQGFDALDSYSGFYNNLLRKRHENYQAKSNSRLQRSRLRTNP